jgi:5'-nucleotidase
VRILVTNDDGIDSTGLHILARAMRPHGDVVIIAPDSEYSGASAAVGALHLSHPEARRELVEGIDEAWSVTGPPALCVMFARLGAFGGRFDLVVSGINPGANVGRSVYHSGTIGATLSGRIGNISGVAVSQSVAGAGVEGQAWDEMILGQHWDTAAAVTSAFVGGLVDALPEDAVVVNLNVPNCPVEEIKGWRHTSVGREPQRPVAKAELVPMVGHDGAYRVAMEWGDQLDLPPETDGGTVEDGYVSVTYLSRLHEIDRPDMDAAEKALSSLVPADG